MPPSNKFAYGGFIDNDNTSHDTYDSRIIDDDSIRHHYHSGKTQKDWYEDRRYEMKDNPYYAGFINYLANVLSTGIYFTGDGAGECKTFFDETCPDAIMQLRLAIKSAIGNGPGFQYFYSDQDGNLKQIITADHENFTLRYSPTGPDDDADKFDGLVAEGTKTSTVKSVDAKWIEITDNGSHKKFYMKNYARMLEKDYQVVNNRLGFLRLIYDEVEPYGEPVGEASYLDMKAMKRLNKNIMAGLERNLSDFIKIGLDMSALDDTEKAAKITASSTELKGIDWNGIDYLVVDERMKLGYNGTYPGDGQGNESRVLEPGKIIEPVLSSILFSYYVAIGLIEQTGANKSLIVAQKKEADRGVNLLRNSVKIYFNTQMKPLITPKQTEMRYKPDLDAGDVVALFVGGVISRDYAQEALGIIDTGSDFAEVVQADAAPNIPSKASDNNDDNPTKGRLGPQSKGVSK